MAENGLWILQTLRQAAETGNPPDAETAAAIFREKGSLHALRPEEILPELTGLLCGESPAFVLRDYREVLAVLLPELTPMFGFEQRNPHHDRDVWEHTIAVTAAAPATAVMRWAALLHDIAKPDCFEILEDGLGHFYGHAHESQRRAEAILVRLGMEQAERERIGELIRYHDFPILPEPKRLARLVRKHGEETVRQLIALHIADTRGQSALCAGRIEAYRQVERALDAYLAEARKPKLILAVDGHDLEALGLWGREVGDALRRCRAAVEAGCIQNEKAPLLNWVRSGFPEP